MRKVTVLLLLTLGPALSQVSAQAAAAPRQVIVFAKDIGLASSPIEVTADAREVSLLKEGTYHSFDVTGQAVFIYVQTAGRNDTAISCGYLATLSDLPGSTCYLEVTRPAMAGTLTLKLVADATARQWLASFKEQK